MKEARYALFWLGFGMLAAAPFGLLIGQPDAAQKAASSGMIFLAICVLLGFLAEKKP